MLYATQMTFCLLLSQSQYGDYDPNFHKPGFLAQDELLPKRVSTQCHVHAEFSKKLFTCYRRKIMLRVCVIVFPLFYACIPGVDAVSNDSWYVGGKDHSLVCRAQRHRQVGLSQEGSWYSVCKGKVTPLQKAYSHISLCAEHHGFDTFLISPLSIQGWSGNGILKNCPGPWDVWCQLLCHYRECKLLCHQSQFSHYFEKCVLQDDYRAD